MKNAALLFLASFVMALGLALSPGAAFAQAQEVCWDDVTIQAALAEERIAPVATVLAREGIAASTQILSVRVCERSEGLYYVLAVLEASGQARTLTLAARPGS